MSNAEPYKRWHDRQPRLAQAVKLLILLPDEVKNIISEAMIELANREFEEGKKNGATRTLGGEKAMGLHKSKNRRREYDVNETLHKAMNYLYILSDEGQDFMAEHILTLVKYIHSYFAACKEFQLDPSPEHIAGITTTYVSRGSQEAEKFLKQLREEFYIKVFSPKNGAKADPSLIEALVSGSKPPPPPGETRPPAEREERKVSAKDDSQGMKLAKQDLD